MRDIEELRQALAKFALDRDWDQFHSPKNLTMALAAEAGELLEQMQWLTEEQSRQLSDGKLQAVSEEIADVFIYLVRLSDKLGIDLLSAAAAKIKRNEAKYPIDKAFGKADKYTEL